MLGRSKTRFNLGEVVIADCACYLVHIAATYGRRAPAAKKNKKMKMLRDRFLAVIVGKQDSDSHCVLNEQSCSQGCVYFSSNLPRALPHIEY